MTDIVVAETGYVSEAPTLARLAAIANREHLKVQSAAQEALAHSILAGEALLAARDRVPPGQWIVWVEENVTTIAYKTVMTYAYLAANKGLLEHMPESTNSQNRALSYLRGLDVEKDSRMHGAWRALPEEIKEEARRLSEEGVNPGRIGKLLGVSRHSIIRWLSPEEFAQKDRKRQRQRRARTRAAARASREGEFEKAARRVGGPTYEAYSLTRKLAQQLERAHDQAESPEARRALSSALSALHSKVEDAIKVAVGLG